MYFMPKNRIFFQNYRTFASFCKNERMNIIKQMKTSER